MYRYGTYVIKGIFDPSKYKTALNVQIFMSQKMGSSPQIRIQVYNTAEDTEDSRD
jgi:hypothetical protein